MVWYLVRQVMLGLCLAMVTPAVSAQNVAGVFGPEVTPGSKAAEVRFAFAPANNGRPDRFTSRLHYQQAVTDTIRLRGVIQGADSNTSDFDFDLVQFEAQWQFREDEIDGWDSAVRADVQIAEGRADVLALNWTSDIPLGDAWTVRAHAQGAVQVGGGRTDGLFLQTRYQVARKLKPGYALKLQLFNFWGTTDDFQDLDDQVHTLGPAITGKLSKHWSFEASTLFGLTRAASDVDLRLFITRSF